MCPLSVPVDTNPIVKTPPVFQDGSISPSGTIKSTFDYSATTTDGTGIAYDPVADEFYICNTGLPASIFVFDGFGGSVKRTLNTAVNATIITFRDGRLFATRQGSSGDVWELDPADGSLLNTITGFTGNVGGFDIKDGNLYRVIESFNNTKVRKYVGITSTLDSEINIGASLPNNEKGLSWFDDLMCIIETTSLSIGSSIHVYDGFTTTELKEITLGSNNIISDLTVVGNDLCGNDNNNDVIERFQSVDDGQNFTGNSGKTLEAGSVYSFEITGPNSVTAPTINDDGQGAKPIVLPGGATIPVGALTGNFDFLYNGSQYVVVSLTEELAAAIYDFQGKVLDNMTATSDPTVNDDSDDGYSVRSRWYNTSTGEAFLAVDVTVGAAVWVKASLTLDELGSAAVENVGTTVGDVAQFEDVGGGTPGYPAVDGSQITNLSGLQKPGASIDPALAFDTWRTPNANRPTLVETRITIQTDGVNSATVFLDVDESGGTVADYSYRSVAEEGGGAGFFIDDALVAMIPAGASYQIRNGVDPNGANNISFVREFTL